MVDFTSLSDVKALQAHLRTSFDGPAGKEVVKFLEDLCGWYDFEDIESNMILIKHGKRQVLATIKTLMRLPAENIVMVYGKTEI